ncbi:hypothetical protein PIB30_036882 [Stylosanthes scabra]|uniref:Uncharacterized protein n=1 Tax=Stylosanthes scabra TaxID=79078 RepID=A0ABU6XCD2_9FABA|nr:hypothetical protein [Stylosanthes scabra]
MGNQKKTVSREGKAVKSKNAAPEGKNPEKKDQGHDFTCVPLSVSTVFRNCLNNDEEKMKIVEELGFGASTILHEAPSIETDLHLFRARRPHHPRRRRGRGNHNREDMQGARTKVHRYKLLTKSLHFPVRIRIVLITISLPFLNPLRFLLPFVGSTYPEKVVSKDLNDDDYAVFKYFQGISQAALKKLIFQTPADTDKNRDLFKRAFLLYIQKCFLLPTSAANISPRALPTIFNLENTRHQNWALHIHNFLLEEVQKARITTQPL